MDPHEKLELRHVMAVPSDVSKWPEFIKAVKKYLSEAPDVDVSTANADMYFYHTSLEIAIYGNCGPLVQALIDHGVDVNHPAEHSPLLQACKEKGCCDSIIRLLIEGGAAINCTNIRSTFVPRSDYEMIQRNLYGTPLSYAIKNSKKASVQLLLSKGADFSHEVRCRSMINYFWVCCNNAVVCIISLSKLPWHPHVEEDLLEW